MDNIRVKCPAKVNLTLEIVNRREDGFHNIKSIMHLIGLYDYIEISAKKTDISSVKLTGVSNEIPYDKSNLVYKAADLFLKETGIDEVEISINIEKNIPVSAGLAGGSTDAAGTLWGLNEIFSKPLSRDELHLLCAKLGSDLNVCLEGGCILATSRGEKIQKLRALDYPITLIKPKFLGISAKEAYTKYSAKKFKPKNNMTDRMINAINNDEDINLYLYNDLEYAVFDDYDELKYIKSKLPNSIMSGSGSTFFVLENEASQDFPLEYEVISGLHLISTGVEKA